MFTTLNTGRTDLVPRCGDAGPRKQSFCFLFKVTTKQTFIRFSIALHTEGFLAP